jgi:hypothetical protein
MTHSFLLVSFCFDLSAAAELPAASASYASARSASPAWLITPASTGAAEERQKNPWSHGFTVDQIVELVRAGLATAHTQRVIVGRRAVEIAHVKITEAGRRALTDKSTQ